jgi:hypothetical protein
MDARRGAPGSSECAAIARRLGFDRRQFDAAVGFVIGGVVLVLIALVRSIAVTIEDQSPLAWSALAIAVLSPPFIGLIYFLFTALFYS